MDKLEMEDAIITAVNSCADDEGWANLAELGNHLREQGLQYKKLSRFLDEFDNLIERRVDYSVTPPVAYARLTQYGQRL